MPLPTQAGMAEGLVIGDSYVLLFNAIDPTDGSDISGVTVSDVNVNSGETDLVPAVGNPILLGLG